jgi:hypothetical protein
MPELMYLSCKIMIGLNIAGIKNLACQSKVALPQPESRCSALRPFPPFSCSRRQLGSGHFVSESFGSASRQEPTCAY